LRWNAEELGTPATEVLAPFRAQRDPDDEEGSPLACSAPYSLLRDPGEPAAFRVLQGDAVLIEGAEANAVLPYFFWHVGVQAARRTGSYLLVHAGAVSSPSGDGLVLTGSSGAGKTTLVAALVRAGFGYLSDETAPFDPVSRRLFPFPRLLALKAGSVDLFPEVGGQAVALGDQWFVPATALRPGSVGEPCVARWLISIRYEIGQPTVLAETTRADAVMDLCRNAMNLHHYGGRALPLLADVARAAHCYRLVWSDLSEAVAMVTGLSG
jgi:hypothetical protein